MAYEVFGRGTHRSVVEDLIIRSLEQQPGLRPSRMVPLLNRLTGIEYLTCELARTHVVSREEIYPEDRERLWDGWRINDDNERVQELIASDTVRISTEAEISIDALNKILVDSQSILTAETRLRYDLQLVRNQATLLDAGAPHSGIAAPDEN